VSFSFDVTPVYVDDEPVIHRTYRELARHYGFQIDPTPAYSPEREVRQGQLLGTARPERRRARTSRAPALGARDRRWAHPRHDWPPTARGIRGGGARGARPAALFAQLRGSRADQSYEKKLLRFTTSDLLIVDDLGIRALERYEPLDLYEIIRARYEVGAMILTSNRGLEDRAARARPAQLSPASACFGASPTYSEASSETSRMAADAAICDREHRRRPLCRPLRPPEEQPTRKLDL
jgi:hypothetical protein